MDRNSFQAGSFRAKHHERHLNGTTVSKTIRLALNNGITFQEAVHAEPIVQF